ncbi:MAG: hypothetical protein AVDCRST_MAG32-2667, partial [uncultured Nocardioides sp.]
AGPRSRPPAPRPPRRGGSSVHERAGHRRRAPRVRRHHLRIVRPGDRGRRGHPPGGLPHAAGHQARRGAPSTAQGAGPPERQAAPGAGGPRREDRHDRRQAHPRRPPGL